MAHGDETTASRLRDMRRWWRESGRPIWRDARPLVVIGLAGLAVVLGTIGYLDKFPRYNFFDSLYRAIGLFGLAGSVEPPVPATLEVARILAPLITGYAAIRGLLALSREQVELLRLRLFRDHLVVAGLGTMGSRLAATFARDGWQVVAIEQDAANPAIVSSRERGIAVITGDASDHRLLAKARVDRASHLIATCGDDGTNVDVAAAAGGAAEDRPGVLTAHVHLGDLVLLRALSAEAVAIAGRPELRLEFFNAFVTGAFGLLETHPPFPEPDGEPRRPHVLVLGATGLGEQVVLRTAARWQASDPGEEEELRITLAGPGARDGLDSLRAAHPELERIARLESRAGGLESVSLRTGLVMLDDEGSCDVTAAYVCLPDESQAMAGALALHSRPQARAIPIVVAVADARSGVAAAMAAEGGKLENIEPFGVLDRALSPALLFASTNELLARAKHDQYVRDQLAAGDTPETTPHLRPWDELSEEAKEANRAFAEGIGPKLRAAGCIVVPAPLADPRGGGFEFSRQEIEDLARLEHDRWVADKLRNGYQPTRGPRDEARKLHPDLVPWEQLDEAAKEKDRGPMRDLPRMLARVGLEIHRASEGEG